MDIFNYTNILKRAQQKVVFDRKTAVISIFQPNPKYRDQIPFGGHWTVKILSGGEEEALAGSLDDHSVSRISNKVIRDAIRNMNNKSLF